MKIITTILLALAICSCGARKVDKTTTEENSVVSKMEHTESNVNKDISTTENKTDCSETTTETVKPIDQTKPAYFIDDCGNKKELINTSYQKKKTVKHINENKVVSNVSDKESKADINSLIGKNKSTADIHDQRDAVSQWNWLWLLIPLIIAYFIWRKSNPVDQVENIVEDIIKSRH